MVATKPKRIGHSRKAKYARHPLTHKKVNGVHLHKTGRYCIWVKENGKAKREYFPATVEGMDRAIRRRASLDNMPMYIPAMTHDESLVDLLALGIDEDYLDANPDIVVAHQVAKRKINLAYAAAFPERELELVAGLFGKHKNAVLENITAAQQLGKSDNPDGERLTVREVGERYRLEYAKDKGIDVAQLKLEAGKKWHDLIGERCVKTRCKEHKRYYDEFVKYLKNMPVDLLTGDHFRDYRDHCRQRARNKKPKVSNPDKWANHRYESIKTAFRRVKREYSVAWGQGIFGEDGHLAILQIKNAAAEASKVIITPSEFRAILKVSCTQFRAVAYLALNAALTNTDIALILWTNLDLDRGVMDFARPKTKRTRRIPLAKATIKALKAWRDEHDGKMPNIFYTPRHNTWVHNNTDSLNKHWDGIRKKSGVDVSFNALRKTAATTANKVTDEKGLKMLLGHAPNASWRHYVDVLPECLQDAVNQISAEFFAKNTKSRKKG